MESSTVDYNPTESLVNHAVRTPYMLQERLRYLHDLQGISWRSIAKMEEEFGGVPHHALYWAYLGKPAKKYWAALNLKAEIETTRIAVHKVDIDSTVRTIMKNFTREKILELIKKLQEALHG